MTVGGVPCEQLNEGGPAEVVVVPSWTAPRRVVTMTFEQLGSKVLALGTKTRCLIDCHGRIED